MEMTLAMGTTLQKVPGTSLYINHTPGEDAYRREYTTFCFSPRTDDPRATLSLAETVHLNGAYAFACESTDGEWPQLQQLMSRYNAGKSLLWTKDWGKADHVLRFSGTTTSAELSIPLATFSALVESPDVLGELGAYVAQGAAYGFEDGRMSLTHADNAFLFKLGPHRDMASVMDGKLALVLEPGPACGAVQCLLAGPDGARVLDLLTPQVQYQFVRDDWDELRCARILADAAPLKTETALRVSLNRDSQKLSRSQIAFADSSNRLTLQLADTAGNSIVVTPSDRAAVYFDTTAGPYASLVGQFAVDSASASAPGSLHDRGSPREVIIGASGTEFFQLGVNGYDGLEFTAGQPAFAILPTEETEGELNCNATTSWFKPCRTKPGVADDVGYAYVAQPQEQPLFGRRTIAALDGDKHPNLLAFDRAAMTVNSRIDMPFLPLQGVLPGQIAASREIDSAVLSVMRAKQATSPTSAIVSRLADEALTWITTPQGLLVQVDQSNQWHCIRLGEGDPDTWKLELKRPKGDNGDYVKRWAIQEALSRPEVFVVITQRSVDGAPNPTDPIVGDIKLSVKLSGWGFAVGLGPDSFTLDSPLPTVKDEAKPGSAFAPVMIIKLSPGPLEELVIDPGKWGLGPVFNDSVSEASRSAQGALYNLKQLSDGISPNRTGAGERKIPAESKKYYQALYKRITQPEWTGILVLNAEAPFGSVPEQVRVLTEQNLKETGEDDTPPDPRDSFGVPVLGIDLSKVSVDADRLKLEKTSVFGAIHYHSPAALSDTDADTSFAFKLRSLNAVFDNSELRTFIASMQLRVASFFGAETVPGKEGAGRLVDIQGRYESKGAKGSENVYVFRALAKRKVAFKGNRFLSHILIERVDVSSRLVGADKKVESRFALGGEIGFGPSFVGVTSVETVAFGSAALVMYDGDFSIDVGDIKVSLASKKDGGGTGLLANFPLQLSALRWSGFSTGSAQRPAALDLAKVGFTRLALPLADMGDDFDFAIELDLNLGSLGKLAEAMQFLKAKVLIGWTDNGRHASDNKPAFCAGFRFDGGSAPLDIGINGVLRLRADEVSLRPYTSPAGIGIGLLRPQLEVMGYKIPDEPDDTLIVFIPDKNPNADPPVSGKELAWVWARGATTVGPLVLDFFAIGQRLRMVAKELPAHANLPALVASAKSTLRPESDTGQLKLPNVGALYEPDAGWGLVANGEISALKFRFIFLDGLNRYGLGLDIPALASFDVTYRKVGDSVGVFSGEITPAFRSLEMGAANVTLPIFSFDAYTNGNWSLNIGYNGNDFSRGTTVQVLPFIGSGGIRFGRLDWRTSYVLNSPGARTLLYKELDLDPVIEMSFALRVGVGKQYENGVFKAGFTASVYGIFEGAFGRPQDPRFPGTKRANRYLRLSGRAGLLIELYGSVNFALVSAIVHIRTWLEFGLLLETWAPITFSAEIGVSVHVRFVIARVKVFGKRYEIAINYRFATKIHAEFKLDQTFDGSIPDIYKDYASLAAPLSAEREALRMAPLNWSLHPSAEPRRKIAVGVTFEALVAEGAPVLVPMLLALQVDGRIPGLDAFCLDLLRWALRLSLGSEPGTVSLEDIDTLSSRVTPPRGVSLARWGDQGLDFARLSQFFDERIELVLQSPPQLRISEQLIREQFALAGEVKDTPEGVFLPWFADIGVGLSQTDGSVKPVRDFRGAHATTVSTEWEKSLFELLAKAAPDYPESASSQQKRERIANNIHGFRSESKHALDVVVEDWAAALVQGIVQRAQGILSELADKDNPNPGIAFEALLTALAGTEDGSPCVQTAQHASTFLNHGLRVPAADDGAQAAALPEFLQTQVSFAELARHGDNCALAFRVRGDFKGSWIVDEARLEEFELAEAGKAIKAAHEQVKLKLNVMLDDDVETAKDARRFAADTLVPLTPLGEAAPSLYIASIPKALARIAARKNTTVELYQIHERTEHAVKGRWAVKIDLRVVPFAPAGANGIAPVGTYAIKGVDPRVRDLLKWMRSDAARPGSIKARLAYAAAAAQNDAQVIRKPPVFVEDDDAYFFISNLSTENAPPQALLLSAKQQPAPTFSRLDDALALAHILSMASKVNGPGFSLAFGDKDPLASVVEKDQVLTLSVLFDVGDAAVNPLTGLTDGLLLDAASVEQESSIGFRTPGIMEARTCAPDGLVAIHVLRDNPMYRPAPADSPQADVQAIAAQYELVDYWTLPGSALALARESVVPVRVHVEENELSLLADEPSQWRHRLSLPVAKMAGAKRRADALLLGTQLAGDEVVNPYALVGVDLRDLVQVGLRDGTGHILPAHALDITWQRSRILYRDFIPTLDELPGVSLSWTARREAGRAKLALDFSWAATNISAAASGEQVAHRLKQWRDQYLKYAQMMEARGFDALARVRLGEHDLGNAAIRPQLAAWLRAIVEQLESTGKTPLPRRCAPLLIDLDLTQLPRHTPAPLALRVQVDLTRDGELCPDSDVYLDVRHSQTHIGPVASADGIDWAALLAGVASTFEGRLTLLKRIDSGTGDTVWLINSSMMPKSTLTVATSTFSAPKPLAKTFQSGSVQVERLNQEPVLVEASEIDLNAVAGRAAAAVEALLRPDTGGVLARMSDMTYRRLTDTKHGFAQAMAGKLASVIEADHPTLPEASTEKFLNACRADARTAFSPTVLVTMHQTRSGEAGTFLYGGISIVNAYPEQELLYSVSPVRVPLGADGPCGAFDFIVRWTDPGSDPVAALSGAMYFAPQYIEVRGEQVANDSTPSDWFEIVWPDVPADQKRLAVTSADSGKPDWTIPLPLRLVPPAPVILHQKLLRDPMQPARNLAEFMRHARTWRYLLSFGTANANQDVATATVRFADRPVALAAPDTGLFDALVAFNYHEGAILRLSGDLRDGGAGVDVNMAAFQIGILETVANRLATAAAAGPAAPLLPVHERTVILDATTTGPTWRLGWLVEPVGYRQSVACRLLKYPATETAEELELPPHALHSEGKDYAEYRLAGDVPDAVSGMAGLSLRSVSMAELDVLRHASASATVRSQRNSQLLENGTKISSEFIFETPLAHTAETLVPHLATDTVFDITLSIGEARPLNDWIELLAKALFDDADRALYTLDLSAHLRMRLAGTSEEGSERVDVLYPLPAIKAAEASDDTALSVLASQVATHLKRLDRAARDHARLQLRLHVYSAAGEQRHKPVLSLTGLYIPLVKLR